MAPHASSTATLLKLGDSDLTVASPEEDVRGHRVLDREGRDVGEVDDLIVDERKAKVRFLEVASGGFLGLGETKLMIPVDAITRIAGDAVCIDESRDKVVGAPRYDPVLVNDSYWGAVYGYYGYSPHWASGYVYPPYPRYPEGW